MNRNELQSILEEMIAARLVASAPERVGKGTFRKALALDIVDLVDGLSLTNDDAPNYERDEPDDEYVSH